MLCLTLLRDGRRNFVADDPRLPEFTPPTLVWWYWDADKLRRGAREFLGIEVADIAALRENDLAVLDTLDLPRVICPEAGLPDGTVADVLRWARETCRVPTDTCAAVA